MQCFYYVRKTHASWHGNDYLDNGWFRLNTALRYVMFKTPFKIVTTLINMGIDKGRVLFHSIFLRGLRYDPTLDHTDGPRSALSDLFVLCF